MKQLESKLEWGKPKTKAELFAKISAIEADRTRSFLARRRALEELKLKMIHVLCLHGRINSLPSDEADSRRRIETGYWLRLARLDRKDKAARARLASLCRSSYLLRKLATDPGCLAVLQERQR
jgi:hypothetical protein